ncbi:GntR family transcriptional regulator, partial [Streptomyces sp900116325]|uniref:GntR family transcriptional regulator n=1 Tax=Streptomyces sp. 900116325 TaxID=3154295 RepID=UPI0033B708C2
MSGQTPCLRIADELRRRIAEHVWEAGDRLPSRAQIGQECGVGENVVRRAQELLISQGVLEGRAGSGTYVAESRELLDELVLQARIPEFQVRFH